MTSEIVIGMQIQASPALHGSPADWLPYGRGCRQAKYPATFMGVLTALCVVIIAVIGTEVYRLAVTATLVRDGDLNFSTASAVAAVLHDLSGFGGVVPWLCLHW